MVLDNGSKFPGEEVLLRGLYELVNGEDKNSIAVNVFGRDWSQQSRVLKYFVNHVYDMFSDFVFDNVEWFHEQGLLAESAKAIENKIFEISGRRFENFDIAMFIDCNCLASNSVLNGPAGPGLGAPRWDRHYATAYYNGWKSHNGLKHQTVDIAHGITVDMHGPISLRRNDMKLFSDSDINARLARVTTLSCFGDSIYPHLSNVCSYHKNLTTPVQEEENKLMKSVRISIEWNYATTRNIFRYLQNEHKLKIMESAVVSKVFVVCTILKNYRVCLYGCQSQSYFSITLSADMLEKYLHCY